MYVVISVIIIIIIIIIILPYYYSYNYFSANILGLYSAYVHGFFFRSFRELCRLSFPRNSIMFRQHVPPKYHKNLVVYDVLNQMRIIWAKAAWKPFKLTIL
jgi:hypothetical protein